MARQIDQIQVSNDYWFEVFNTVNILANTFAETFTLVANSTGDVTTGNGAVNGSFSANTLAVTTALRGGTITTPAVLAIVSNASFSGANVVITSNTSVRSGNFSVGNATVVSLAYTNGGSSSNVDISANTLNVSSNATFTGKVMRIPSGATADRPASPSNGMVRYNTDTSLIEVYAGGSWTTLAVSNTGEVMANSVTFVPVGSVSSNTVQLAIAEVDAEKVAKSGDVMTGTLYVNRNGQSMPSALTGAVIQGTTPDSTTIAVDLTAFSNWVEYVGRRAGGTAASPAALGTDQDITILSARGRDQNTYSTVAGHISIKTSQAWTNTAHGTRIELYTTPNGSVTSVNTATFSANGSSINSDLTVNGALSATSISGASINYANTSANGVVMLAANSDAANSSAALRVVTPQALHSIIGSAIQPYNANYARLDVELQAVSGGATVSSKNLGTITSGTLIPNPGARALQHLVANGAFALSPGANTGYYVLDITMGSSAGAISTSGWTKVVGAFTTTNGHKFRCFGSIGTIGSLLSIQPMQ